MATLLDKVFTLLVSLWGPGLEVLILTFLFYVLLSFLHGTRGAGILRGLIILIAGSFATLLALATFAQLENIRWIMENLFAIAIIAFIVVFQPEIRRGLIRLGESPSWVFINHSPTGILNELVTSMVTMSKRNIGAIIVIERDTRLGNYVDGGVRLDASVGSELLCTIFHPKTPLHDGAVIIRQGRIIAANCLLPFTENTDICRGMGARHRAGIGLSEESDAVVLIISEETGGISVAIKGEIRQHLDPIELESLLREECAEEIDGALGVENNE